MQNTKYRKKGFTLLELVLTIAIIGIMVGLLAPILINGVKSYMLVMSRRVALAESRLAMSRMVSEIMLIPDRDEIDVWDPSEIQFDLQSEYNIRYSVDDGNLERKWTVIAESVSALNFRYLDANGDPATSRDDIEIIEIEIVTSAAAEQGTVRIKTAVFPRNFSEAYAGFE